MSTTSITLTNRLAELERVALAVETFGQRLNLPAQAVFDLTLAIDEVVTNIISYAYEDDRVHEIVVRLTEEDGDVVVEIEDDGRPFDPSKISPPRLDLPVEQRTPGGLGLHLVRKVTDAAVYERRHDRNVLVLRKRIAAARGAAPVVPHATEISVAEIEGVAVVAIVGRLDASGAPFLGEKLRDEMGAAGPKLVIDGRRIEFIGSAGLQVLLAASKRMAASGGRLVLAGISDVVRQVFEIAGLSSAFDFHRTLSAAIAAVR